MSEPKNLKLDSLSIFQKKLTLLCQKCVNLQKKLKLFQEYNCNTKCTLYNCFHHQGFSTLMIKVYMF